MCYARDLNLTTRVRARQRSDRHCACVSHWWNTDLCHVERGRRPSASWLERATPRRIRIFVFLTTLVRPHKILRHVSGDTFVPRAEKCTMLTTTATMARRAVIAMRARPLQLRGDGE
jgi:hypothetical protein